MMKSPTSDLLYQSSGEPKGLSRAGILGNGRLFAASWVRLALKRGKALQQPRNVASAPFSIIGAGRILSLIAARTVALDWHHCTTRRTLRAGEEPSGASRLVGWPAYPCVSHFAGYAAVFFRCNTLTFVSAGSPITGKALRIVS